MTELLHRDLTGKILRSYFNVYNGTSRVYPEGFFDRAMLIDLREAAVSCVYHPTYEIIYKDKIVGRQELDILVAEEVVVENKVSSQLTRLHKAQLLSYQKVTGKQIGLLLNFGAPKPEFQRVYFANRQPEPPADPASALPSPDGWIEPETVYKIVGGLFEVHNTLGPGFIHRIYANACYHELQTRGMPVKPQRVMQVYYREELLGELRLAHLRVSDSILVFPVSIQNINDIKLDTLKDWMRTERTPLGILANFHNTRLKPVILRV